MDNEEYGKKQKNDAANHNVTNSKERILATQ